LIDSGVISQVREELWESQDKTTTALIDQYESADYSQSINFDEFKKKYDV